MIPGLASADYQFNYEYWRKHLSNEEKSILESIPENGMDVVARIDPDGLHETMEEVNKANPILSNEWGNKVMDILFRHRQMRVFFN